jgi:hypothetical protein
LFDECCLVFVIDDILIELVKSHKFDYFWELALEGFDVEFEKGADLEELGEVFCLVRQHFIFKLF